MAALLLDLVEYLKENNLVVNDGEDAFRDTLPDDPDNIVILTEYTGSPINSYLGAVHRSVQIAVRNVAGDDARRKALSICELLNVESKHIKLSNGRMLQVYIRNTPVKIDTDSRT